MPNASSSESVTDAALRLPPDDRARLAHRLLLSLEDERIDPHADAAWIEEAQARVNRYEAGETTADDWRSAVNRVADNLRNDS